MFSAREVDETRSG